MSRAGLVVATVTTAIAVGRSQQLANQTHVELVVTACAAYVVMLAADREWGGLNLGLVIAAAGTTIFVAMSGPAHFTADLWSYAMYGRMVAAHHASPYTHLPASFPHDPMLQQVGRVWRHTPSVYGPAFTGMSAAAAFVLGTRVHATELFYQGLAAAGVLAAAALVWRRTRSAGAVAFLTVHPLIVMFVLSGARNDILVGLALLAAIVLVEDGRPATGGVVAGLGALVKISGAVGLVALAVTVLVRGDRRATQRLAYGGAGVITFGYLLAGSAALFTPMKTAGALYSRGSAWQVLPSLGFQMPDAHLALAVLAALVIVVIARHARGPAGTAVAGSLTMLSLGAAWALPGYAVWSLPAAALDHRSRVAWISAGSGLVLLVTYEILRQPFLGSAPLTDAALVAGPVAMAALIVALLFTRAPAAAGAPSPRSRHPMPDMEPARMPVPASASLARTLVVIPTLDEALNIATVLTRIRKVVPGAHLLVVDDGSTDGTPEIADELARSLGNIRVLRRSGPRGLGPAYRAGFAIGMDAGFDILVEMDADLSHDPHDLPALIEAVDRGADLAIGSRYVDGGLTVGWPARREALSRAGGWYARTLLRSPVRDITGGFRAYRAGLLRAIDLESITTTGYGFQIEMTHRAQQAGAVVSEVPIVFRERTAGRSKMSLSIVVEAMLLVARTSARARGPARTEQPLGSPVTVEAAQ